MPAARTRTSSRTVGPWRELVAERRAEALKIFGRRIGLGCRPVLKKGQVERERVGNHLNVASSKPVQLRDPQVDRVPAGMVGVQRVEQVDDLGAAAGGER